MAGKGPRSLAAFDSSNDVIVKFLLIAKSLKTEIEMNANSVQRVALAIMDVQEKLNGHWIAAGIGAHAPLTIVDNNGDTVELDDVVFAAYEGVLGVNNLDFYTGYYLVTLDPTRPDDSHVFHQLLNRSIHPMSEADAKKIGRKWDATRNGVWRSKNVDDAVPKCITLLDRLIEHAELSLRINSISDVCDAETVRDERALRNATADKLDGQALKLFKFLAEKEYSTSFDTLAEEKDFWRNKNEYPTDSTIDKALKRLSARLSKIEPIEFEIEIRKSERRVKLIRLKDKGTK